MQTRDDEKLGDATAGAAGSGGIDSPSITLPRGGGAIRGIGEKFAANPVTGTGSLSVPIATSPGRSGFGPQLSLSYDSGAGNGPFGFGWQLGLPAISRRTEKGLPTYADEQESDVFILSGAEDLVPERVQGGDDQWHRAPSTERMVGGVRYRVDRYRPRIEGLFARIERWRNLGDPTDVFWRSITRNNLTSWYGRTSASRIADPLDARRIFAWLLCQSHDDKGNVAVYGYKPEDDAEIFHDVAGQFLSKAHERNRATAARTAQRYLKRVRYGNRIPYFPELKTDTPWPEPPNADVADGSSSWLFEAVFDYGEHTVQSPTPQESRLWPCRPDPFSSYRPAFEIRTYRLCRRVLMFHHFEAEEGVGRNCLVGSTDFAFSDATTPSDARNPIYAFLTAVTATGYRRTQGGYNSRTLPPLSFTYTTPRVQGTLDALEGTSLDNLPAGIDGAAYRWVDLHGEGTPGALSEQGGAWLYKRNWSPLPERQSDGSILVKARLAALETVAIKPNMSLTGGAEFMDLAGTGQADVVQLGVGTPGLYAHDKGESWRGFRPFREFPTRNLRDPNLRFIDLDGDGRADLLITEDEALVWHASLANDGFGPARRVQLALDEEHGPRAVFADGTQSIFLADMSGDGLTDIVRIRSGEVCYWPNLGYCRFGPKVTMDNAPCFDAPDQFDYRRLRLADIDGSGTTDLIYLHRDGVQLYFNQSGNGWSQAQRLDVFPRVDDLVHIMPIDLLGNGTACLVWSSGLPDDSGRPLRYVNLMGGHKPHLLVGVSNNLGAETHIHYAPSTKFYLQDKQDGRPWVTRLPFPVHVVEKVESVDHISRNRFVTRYAYHHGYFDSEEREFRGFGMVEQFDTETFEDYIVGVQSSLGGQAIEPELNQPPVTSRTWFHTGAFVDQSSIQQQFQREYYQQHQHLSTSVVPDGLSIAEQRECARALKGLPLRQEIYSFDGSPEAVHPYAVTETNYEVRCLQRRGGGRHAVFLPVSRESISFNYERDPADPRVAHTFGLDLDEYGGARKTCSVVYGRRTADPSLPAEVTRDQQQGYLTCSETDYTPDIVRNGEVDVYRLRVPFETRSYEVTGLSPAAQQFQFAELKAGIATADPIDYEAVADATAVQKRLLGQARTLFLSNALVPAPLGQWDSLALPYERYTLALTPAVVTAHYAGQIAVADLSAAGYVHVAGDANWWVPSGTAVYPTDPRNTFYTPIGTRDPFGIETTARFDAYTLLTESVAVKQATWSVVSAKNDYRVLGPVQMTDPNGNRSAVEHDELGYVIRSAIMGKLGAGEGDTIADPTSRMEYELFNWMRNRLPNFVRTLAREQHGAANPRWQESYTYSNGSGGVALIKAQAHPGKALTVSPGGSVIEVDADPRWIGNGRTVLNNKGKPVKQYEPYFSTTHAYEDERQLREIGVTPVLYYDPLGRNVRTLSPDGALSSVAFTPWWQKVYDACDAVKRSLWYAERGSPDPASEPEPQNDPDRRAAWLAAKHADTPTCAHFDSLGRPVYTVSDYGYGKTAAVRSESDLTGRHVRMFDQLQREIASMFVGMAGSAIMSVSAEKGRRWTFQNVLGGLVKTWDDQGRQFRAEYDALHRPVCAFVKQGTGPEILFNYVVYGDRLDEATARSRNLLGAAHLIFDQAGMVRVPALTFQGHPASVDRILAADYKHDLDWRALSVQTDVAGILATAMPALEAGEIFSAHSLYDALNRPTRVTLPDGSIFVPRYNEANFLASLSVQIRGQGSFVDFLKNQDYDAKGQRLFAQYGNDVLTRYFYDAKTFRLTNLVTHQSGTDATTQSLQNLHYHYDPVGNITQIRDDAQQTHYFNNAVVNPESRFEYDAIYQLVRATGRELAGGVNEGIRTNADLGAVQLPHANNVGAVRRYTEEYEYDLLGNIKVLKHRFAPQAGLGGGWTRHYRYAFEDSPGNLTNRLTASSLGADPEAGPYTATYAYDAYGNMTSMPHLAAMAWNFMDQLRSVDLGGGGTAHYVYGVGGQRLRKVIERQGNLTLEWIFLGAVSIHRRRRRNTGELRLERCTVHISDSAGPIAQVDTKTRDEDNDDPANPLSIPLIRYQFANHLGSAVLETDQHGTPVSYEEYHPYGTSAYRTSRPGADLSLKRYRFSGKECDDETGLYYFGARYYAPWLGRWTSSDPAGFVRGFDLYRYASNNPVMFIDPNGMDDVPVRSASLGRGASWASIQGNVPSGYRIRAGITAENYRGHWTGREGGYWDVLERIPGDAGSSPGSSGGLGVSGTPAASPPAPDPAPVSGTPATPPASPAASPHATPDEPRDSASPLGTALTAAPGIVTRAVWALPDTLRGTAIDYLAGNNLGLMNEGADILDARNVIQVKSNAGADLPGTTRTSTRAAQGYIDANPTTTAGRTARAETVFPENAPRSAEAAVEGALTARPRVRTPDGRHIADGGRAAISGDTPIASRGLPRRARIGGGALAVAGLGLGAYSLWSDLTQEGGPDVPMAVGDAISVVGSGAEIYGLAGGGAMALRGGLIGAGLGMGITSGVRAYREFSEGDTLGGVVDTIGVVGGGMLIAAALVASAPLAAGLAIGGGLIALGVFAFHALRGH